MKFFMSVCVCAGVLLVAGCWLGGTETTSSVRTGEHVVVLHGMGRTENSMRRVTSVLEEQGYTVLNLGYPSTKKPIPELVRFVDAAVRKHLGGKPATVHFVTHSLGGILVRCYLGGEVPFRRGRVVMLAPPNQGSEVTDELRSIPPYAWVTGPAGMVLGTTSNDLPQTLPPVPFELGVIAGDRTWNPLYSWFVVGADDGKVSVERTKVKGMKDFIVLHASHTWIMWRREVLDQVVAFLADGAFQHDE